jgi:hypothetical protein
MSVLLPVRGEGQRREAGAGRADADADGQLAGGPDVRRTSAARASSLAGTIRC